MNTHRNALAVLVALLGASGTAWAASLTLVTAQTSSHVGNLIANGSFETSPGAEGDRWATGTTSTPFTAVPSWTSAGGPNAYAYWTANGGNAGDGNWTLYFGNLFLNAVSPAPSFGSGGLVTFSSSPTFTPDPNFAQPVTLSQTITGLNVGNTYLLDFWAAGEDSFAPASQQFPGEGFFGLDITGFSTVYLAAPSGNGPLGQSHRYQFLLQPASSTTTITFTNWGHAVLPTGPTTELILDDVILNDVTARVVPLPAAAWGGLVLLGVIIALRKRRVQDRPHDGWVTSRRPSSTITSAAEQPRPCTMPTARAAGPGARPALSPMTAGT